MINLRSELRRMWAESPILVVTTFLMLATFVFSSVGIFADSRIITGAPAWLKPAKFGISTAIYTATLAWMYRYLGVWRGLLRVAAWTISLAFILEIALIDMQAARGVASHFNNSTPFDKAVFLIMGVGIVFMMLSSIVILLALFKQTFEEAWWGWALRLGMLITVIGSASGGLMIAPHPDQLRALKAHEPVAAIGGHTVGAPDGGPGLPGTDWSTEHGDLRVPHFLGMHGMQLIPLFAWLFARRRTAMVLVAVASYLALFAILTWQALSGESIVQPDPHTLILLAMWLVASAVALIATRVSRTHERRPALT